MPHNPIDDFEVDPAGLRSIGRDLQRPECILAEADGTLWSADSRGGAVRIGADGEQMLVAEVGVAAPASAAEQVTRIVNDTLPNGLAFARNGDILIANFGADRLEVMTRNGESKVLYDSIDGKPLGRVNFVPVSYTHLTLSLIHI